MKSEQEILDKIAEARKAEVKAREYKRYHGASDWANFKSALEWVLE